MYQDTQNTFSDAQAITASAASTNVIDSTVALAGPNKLMPIQFNVTTTFESAGASTLTITLQSSSAEAFGTYTTHWSTDAIAKASLVEGYSLELPPIPVSIGQYVRLYYTVGVANFTAGNADAFPVLDRQTNNYEAIKAQYDAL